MLPLTRRFSYMHFPTLPALHTLSSLVVFPLHLHGLSASLFLLLALTVSFHGKNEINNEIFNQMTSPNDTSSSYSVSYGDHARFSKLPTDFCEYLTNEKQKHTKEACGPEISFMHGSDPA
jgi:hypothetical protein